MDSSKKFLKRLEEIKLTKKTVHELDELRSHYPKLNYAETEVLESKGSNNLCSIYNISKKLNKRRNKDARELAKELGIVVFNAFARRSTARVSAKTIEQKPAGKFSTKGLTETRYVAKDVQQIINSNPELKELRDLILAKFRRKINTRGDFSDFLKELGYKVARHSGDDVMVTPTEFEGRGLRTSVWEQGGKHRKLGINRHSVYFRSILKSLSPKTGNILRVLSKIAKILFKKNELGASLDLMVFLHKNGVLESLKGIIKKTAVPLESAIQRSDKGQPMDALINMGVVELTV